MKKPDKLPEKEKTPLPAPRRKVLGRGLDALLRAGVEDIPLSRPAQQEIASIPVDAIRPNPFQPRTAFSDESIDRLAKSLKERGVLQPILVTRKPDGYELVAGERRLRAAKAAGLARVPCVITELGEGDMLVVALMENIQREDLNPIDLAEGLHSLKNNLKLTQQEIADRLGLSRPFVANALRLLELPPVIQDLVRSGELAPGAARALIPLPAAAAEKIALRAASEGWAVRQVEEICRRISSAKRTKEHKQNGGKAAGATGLKGVFADLGGRLSKHFGTRVTLKTLKDGGAISIRYHSNDDLERVLEILGLPDSPI